MPSPIAFGATSARSWGWSGNTAVKDPYFSSVTLLCHFNNGNNSTTFTDSSSLNQTITPLSGAIQSSDYVKFGVSSFYSPSVTVINPPPYLRLPNTYFNFGTENFTIEFWYYYIAGQSPQYGGFFDNGGQGVYASFGDVPTKLLLYGINAQVNATGFAHGMTSNAWNFLAFVRNGTTVTAYVNGNSIGSWTGITGSFNPAAGGGSNAFISAYTFDLVSYAVGGYIDELRITNGVARYTSNFTPPTSPFPNS